nr:MAG TPA: hypothetical protein [Caudoviricetes sp.]
MDTSLIHIKSKKDLCANTDPNFIAARRFAQTATSTNIV